MMQSLKDKEDRWMKEKEMHEAKIKMVREALQVKMGNMCAEVGVKQNELEVLQDEVLHCKYENDLIEGELENRKEEINAIKQEYKEKIRRFK